MRRSQPGRRVACVQAAKTWRRNILALLYLEEIRHAVAIGWTIGPVGFSI